MRSFTWSILAVALLGLSMSFSLHTAIAEDAEVEDIAVHIENMNKELADTQIASTPWTPDMGLFYDVWLYFACLFSLSQSLSLPLYVSPLCLTWHSLSSPYTQLSATDIDGNKVSMNKYAGDVVLVVNVASQCGTFLFLSCCRHVHPPRSFSHTSRPLSLPLALLSLYIGYTMDEYIRLQIAFERLSKFGESRFALLSLSLDPSSCLLTPDSHPRLSHHRLPTKKAFTSLLSPVINSLNKNPIRMKKSRKRSARSSRSSLTSLPRFVPFFSPPSLSLSLSHRSPYPPSLLINPPSYLNRATWTERMRMMCINTSRTSFLVKLRGTFLPR